jgi:predicted nucleotidyltransferase
VDLLVKFNDDASMLDLVHIRNGVRSIVMRDVDVVSSRGLSPFLGKRILSEAVAL